jgi:hypothetical protein
MALTWVHRIRTSTHCSKENSSFVYHNLVLRWTDELTNIEFYQATRAMKERNRRHECANVLITVEIVNTAAGLVVPIP